MYNFVNLKIIKCESHVHITQSYIDMKNLQIPIQYSTYITEVCNHKRNIYYRLYSLINCYNGDKQL